MLKILLLGTLLASCSAEGGQVAEGQVPAEPRADARAEDPCRGSFDYEHCAEFLPAERMQGVWVTGFEQSGFIPGPPPCPIPPTRAGPGSGSTSPPDRRPTRRCGASSMRCERPRPLPWSSLAGVAAIRDDTAISAARGRSSSSTGSSRCASSARCGPGKARGSPDCVRPERRRRRHAGPPVSAPGGAFPRRAARRASHAPDRGE